MKLIRNTIKNTNLVIINPLATLWVVVGGSVEVIVCGLVGKSVGGEESVKY